MSTCWFGQRIGVMRKIACRQPMSVTSCSAQAMTMTARLNEKKRGPRKNAAADVSTMPRVAALNTARERAHVPSVRSGS